MGLTSWRQAPDGKILKSDVSIDKNYLNEQHINELNQIVSAYLDLAENRAQRHIIMNMNDWIKFLHSFLELSNYPILKDKGKISALQAKLKAESEYEKYCIIQYENYISDFDKEIKRIKGKKTQHATYRQWLLVFRLFVTKLLIATSKNANFPNCSHSLLQGFKITNKFQFILIVFVRPLH